MHKKEEEKVEEKTRMETMIEYRDRLAKAARLLDATIEGKHGYKTRAKEFHKLITQIRKDAPKIKHITTEV